MFDEYLYIVKVYDIDETYEYQYGNLPHAQEHYLQELSKGNKATLYRSKDDVLERYQERFDTWGR